MIPIIPEPEALEIHKWHDNPDFLACFLTQELYGWIFAEANQPISPCGDKFMWGSLFETETGEDGFIVRGCVSHNTPVKTIWQAEKKT